MIIACITSEEYLKKWALLSLVARCEQIKVEFGVTLSRYTLTQLYKRQKISLV